MAWSPRLRSSRSGECSASGSIRRKQARIVEVAPYATNIALALNAAALYIGQALGAGIGGATLANVGIEGLSFAAAAVAAGALVMALLAGRSRRGSAGQIPRLNAVGIDRKVMPCVMPVGQHVTLAHDAIDHVLVPGRAVGMTVDHSAHTLGAKRVGDGICVDVHDDFGLQRLFGRHCGAVATAPARAAQRRAGASRVSAAMGCASMPAGAGSPHRRYRVRRRGSPACAVPGGRERRVPAGVLRRLLPQSVDPAGNRDCRGRRTTERRRP